MMPRLESSKTNSRQGPGISREWNARTSNFRSKTLDFRTLRSNNSAQSPAVVRTRGILRRLCTLAGASVARDSPGST